MVDGSRLKKVALASFYFIYALHVYQKHKAYEMLAIRLAKQIEDRLARPSQNQRSCHQGQFRAVLTFERGYAQCVWDKCERRYRTGQGN